MTTKNEGWANQLAHRIRGLCRFDLPRTTTLLLFAIVAIAISETSYAQTLIGTPGAGWQTWNTNATNTSDLGDLNSNGAPYWDVPFLTFNGGSGYGGNPANKSIGWCLTSTGDCQGIGSALFAPGALPFWGMPYDPVADDPLGAAPGALDPKMYFRSSRGASYTATLYLNTATNTSEINEFGWFETNSTGTLNGTKHVLFRAAEIRQAHRHQTLLAKSLSSRQPSISVSAIWT